MPYPISMRDIFQPQFDTIFLPSQLSGQRANGFLFPLGAMVPVKHGTHVKTENDTSLLISCMLYPPKTFLIQRIECYFVDDEGIISAKSRWYAESTIAVFVGTKKVYTASIAKCAAMAAIVNMEKEVLLTKDDFDRLRAETTFSNPVEIRQQEYFKVEATFSDWCMDRWEKRTAPSKLCVYLDGILTLPEM